MTDTDSLRISEVITAYDTTTNKPLAIDENGDTKMMAYWPGDGTGLPSDSLAFRRAGQSARVNTISWMTAYNGTVGASGLTAARDSANFLWGNNAGPALTTGYRNVIAGNSSGTALAAGYENFIGGYNVMKNAASAYRNIAIGHTIGDLATQTGTGNILMGYQTARNLTSGSNNIFNGFQSGYSVTSGGHNVGIGYAAMFANTLTGSNNIGIGSLAAYGLDGSSANNIAIGEQAMGATGGDISGNIAIGQQSSRVLQSSGSVAIGGGSLFNATTGINTAIGSSAGQSITTGTGNFAMGLNSMYTVTNSPTVTGSYNVAIGDYSGSPEGVAGAKNYNGNTSIGYRAGLSITTGGDVNTMIGPKTAFGQTVSGESNILIGYGSQLPSASSDNQINLWVGGTASVVGNSVSGAGGYNALTRFTGGGWLLNQTTSAVTTQTASAALEINGTTGALLLPRLTTTQRDTNIGTPSAGMVIFNTTTSKFQGYDGSTWVDFH